MVIALPRKILAMRPQLRCNRPPSIILRSNPKTGIPLTLDNVHKRLLDNLTTGVMLLDENLCLVYLNMAAENLLEISDRKARDLHIGEIFVGANEDLQEMNRAVSEHLSYTKHKAELRLMNGKDITVDYTLNSFDENGSTQVLLELKSQTRSDRINREKAFTSTQATTRELVRGLAHEIKNPLGGIRGAAQLLALELPDEELKDYTNVIIEEADRLHNLVDRLVGARKPPEFRAVNIHEILERIKSLVEAEINDGSIKLVRDYDPSIPPIAGDSEQLIQALLNIVRNAMQALVNPSVDHDLGKIILRTRIARNVSIGSEFHRLALSIDIIDNGPGIPEDLIANIFYPMISGRADGTGLGLSITHSIVSQHNGIIECHSSSGNTVFSLLLPLLHSQSSKTIEKRA